jgi:hypothetical protein
MKVTHFSNSFIMVSLQVERTVCDPWVHKANASGWQSFPEFNVSALRKPWLMSDELICLVFMMINFTRMPSRHVD